MIIFRIKEGNFQQDTFEFRCQISKVKLNFQQKLCRFIE